MYAVEPSINDHPKCEALVASYGRCSFTRIKPQGVSFKKRSGHIYCMEVNRPFFFSTFDLDHYDVTMTYFVTKKAS